MELKYIVNDETNLKKILKEKLSISRRLYNKVISEYIYLNGVKIDFKTILHRGDIITIKLDYEEENSNVVAIDKNLKILYEDDWLLVVDKPSNMPVHPSMRHYEDSLSNGVKFYYDKIGLHKKIRPINRLDKDTSGIVIFAKNEYIQDNIKIIYKEYVAVVNGILDIKKGTINKPIARKQNSIIERCIDENGETAITHYEVIKEFINNNVPSDSYSILKCILDTGRTHQIRVHLASIGHPILGDTLYSKKTNLISRQALHCHNMKFIHPISKEIISIISPIDFNNILNFFNIN